MPTHDALTLPLRFQPVYMNVVWGGRRLEQQRHDLPEGPVGESWELADHERGMSVLAEGALAGTSLRQLCANYGKEIVGSSYDGGDFPLLIKVIDAQDRLSVQVHPDDTLATEHNWGARGKTECWLMLGDGGELFQGTAAGINKAAFESALAMGDADTVSQTLNRFETKDGDFFFLPARTIHALGRNCLLVEVQQTADITFRVYDWGRVGLDGKPRATHVQESLQTIDFDAAGHGPVPAAAEDHPRGGSVRRLVSCDYFSVEERRGAHLAGGRDGSCSIVVNLGATGTLATAAGAVTMQPLQTWLVPACAGPWTASASNDENPLRLLVSHPN